MRSTAKILFLLFAPLVTTLSFQVRAADADRPALVLAIIVDQFRYEYLTREPGAFTGGLRRFLDEGAIFTDANYEVAPTVTAVGHSTIGTGAHPSVSGIAGNTWYSRSEQRHVQSITDDNVIPLGGGTGASPHRLLVNTLADSLKAGTAGMSYGVSLKDRSAILPVGHTADGAFWFDSGSGNFVSSSWYFPALPDWVESFNAEHPADAYAREAGIQAGAGERYVGLDATPWADRLVLDFALRLLAAEELGTDAATDFLSVSFSAMDYLGHASGPDTPQMRDMIMAVDRNIGMLLDAAERQAGSGNLLVVFTADHGVAPVPEQNAANKLPGGRYDTDTELAAMTAALNATFGAGDYIEAVGEYSYYLNPDPVPGKQISRTEVEQVAAETLRRQPHVQRVYTRTALENGQLAGDAIDRRIRNGFNAANSGDIVVLHNPNWLKLEDTPGGTTHGSPYSYDTHVPLVFWGSPALVKPGRYHSAAAIHDIAPTLSTLLGVAKPGGASGRILSEIFR